MIHYIERTLAALHGLVSPSSGHPWFVQLVRIVYVICDAFNEPDQRCSHPIALFVISVKKQLFIYFRIVFIVKYFGLSFQTLLVTKYPQILL